MGRYTNRARVIECSQRCPPTWTSPVSNQLTECIYWPCFGNRYVLFELLHHHLHRQVVNHLGGVLIYEFPGIEQTSDYYGWSKIKYERGGGGAGRARDVSFIHAPTCASVWGRRITIPGAAAALESSCNPLRVQIRGV